MLSSTTMPAPRTLRLALLALLLPMLCLVAPPAVHAQLDAMPRAAVIMGNGDYAFAPLENLDNPVNDARAMNGVLRDLRFDVALLQNGDLATMRDAIRQMSRLFPKDGIGLFYYAGHPPASFPAPGPLHRPAAWLKNLKDALIMLRDARGTGGKGVPWGLVNTRIAIRACLRSIADLGNVPRLLFTLGRALAIAERFEEADEFYRQAAQRNYSASYKNLGYMYRTGRGRAVDAVEAARYYREAALRGNPSGHAALATLYREVWASSTPIARR